MALLKFKSGLAANLVNKAVEDGVVYITTDSQEMKVDIGGKRIAISDFVIADRITAETGGDVSGYLQIGGDYITSYQTNLFYYVKGETFLRRYVETKAPVEEGQTLGAIVWFKIGDTSELDSAIAALGQRMLAAEGEINGLKTADNDINGRIDNLNAGNIDTTDEITITTAVGNYKVGDKIDPDTNLQEVLLTMLCADSAPSVTAPSISLSNANSSNAHTYIEVGSASSLVFTASFNDGKYPYGYAVDADGNPDTNLGADKDKAIGVKADDNAINHPVSATAFVITYDDGDDATSNTWASDATKTSLSATVSSGIQTTRVEKNVSASVTYGDGNIPVSILKNKYQSKRIVGATKNASQNGFRWYEPAFYGFKYEGALIDDPEAITASQITALGSSVTGSNAWDKKAPTSSTATGAWRQYFVAVPVNYGKELKSITDTTNQPVPFTKKSSNVTISLGDATVEYEVFYVTYLKPYETLTFTMVWA